MTTGYTRSWLFPLYELFILLIGMCYAAAANVNTVDVDVDVAVYFVVGVVSHVAVCCCFVAFTVDVGDVNHVIT